MRKLIVSILLAVGFFLQSSLAVCQRPENDHFETVPLPTWLDFTLKDHTTDFSFRLTNTDDVLAAYDETNQLRVAVPRGNGGGLIFKPNLEIPFRPRLSVADLDGDSKAEVLVCSDKLRIYRVQKDGLSLVWTSQETFQGSPSAQLGLSDLDADGHIDIVLLNYLPEKNAEGESLYLYFNKKANAQFSLAGTTTFTDEHGYHSTFGLAIADFSGDERPDLVVGNDNGWMWLLETKDENPRVKKNWKVPSGGAIGRGLSAGNMVAGSKRELLVGTNGGDIFVYQFPADGDPQVIAKATAGRLSYGVHAADLDDDGFDEFVLARGLAGYAGMTQKDVVTEIWKLTDGELSAIWQKEATGLSSHQLMLQDLDQDGTPELVIFGKGKPVVAVKPVLDR